MRILPLCLFLLATPVPAHEFWIEPLDYQPSADGMLVGDIVNGQVFAGVRLPYLPPRIIEYVVVNGDQSQPVEMRIGDSPGLNTAPLGDGLNVVGYHSTISTVTYDDFAAFLRFVTHKDLLGGPDAVTARHRARDLSDDGFQEAYARFSKTLIGVGTGAGADRRIGFETELVALTNPYTDDLSGGFRVQLFYGGAVRADEQIEIFDKAPDGTVEVTTTRTDAAGIATIPVTSGHAYMLDAVLMREPSVDLATETGAVWETLWANLTFAAP